jgi:hypothetical protein
VKNYRVLYSTRLTLGLKYQNDILDAKMIRTLAFNYMRTNGLHKSALCNGVINIKDIGYLGYFAEKQPQTLKEFLIELLGSLFNPQSFIYFYNMKFFK